MAPKQLLERLIPTLGQFQVQRKSTTKIFAIKDNSDKEDLMVEIQRMIELVNHLTVDYQLAGKPTRICEYAFLNDLGNRADGFSFRIK